MRPCPDRVALRTRGGEQEITWGEYGERVDRFALGLKGLGLERGDVFALMLTNRPEFHIADTAAISLGATPFSLYQTLTPDQIAYQLNDSGAEIVVTEPAFLDRVLAAREQAPGVRHVVLVDARRRGRRRDRRSTTCSRPRATADEIAARARRSSRTTC